MQVRLPDGCVESTARADIQSAQVLSRGQNGDSQPHVPLRRPRLNIVTNRSRPAPRSERNYVKGYERDIAAPGSTSAASHRRSTVEILSGGPQGVSLGGLPATPETANPASGPGGAGMRRSSCDFSVRPRLSRCRTSPRDVRRPTRWHSRRLVAAISALPRRGPRAPRRRHSRVPARARGRPRRRGQVRPSVRRR